MVAYPPRVSLARLPTPFHKLTRLSEELRVNLWIKRDDLSGLLLSGNKVRKLEFSLARAMADGCDAIITCGGVQSNHCRATAFACAQLGLEAHLVLRGQNETPYEGNLLLDEVAGAFITMLPPDQYRRSLRALLRAKEEELSREGKRPFVIPTGASDGHGIWGYVAGSEELMADFNRENIQPKAIFCATGSGGTQAGLTLGMHLLGSGVPVCGVAVCDDSQYFHSKVGADISQWCRWYGESLDVSSLPVWVNDGYIGPGYAVADGVVYDTIRMLARKEGIMLDPVYTGKAFHGLLTEIRKGQFAANDDIVFVHTGGLYGNFAHRQQLSKRGEG